MIFGNWTKLEDTCNDKYNQIKYKCRCVCGVERFVSKYNLEKGHTLGCQSCSHKKRCLDGKRFGSLVVIKYVGKGSSLCLCDCGNEKQVLESNLQMGHVRSCGCLRSINREGYDEDLKTKILSNIKTVNDCWEWQLSKNNQGYGHLGYKRSVQLAHRVAWKVFKGEIPTGLNVCHKCDNPSCVNPDHLFLGTHSENTKDMFAKGRKIHKGIFHPRAKLTEEDVINIRQMIDEGHTQESICQKYNITNGHVGSIKYKRTWKHVA